MSRLLAISILRPWLLVLVTLALASSALAQPTAAPDAVLAENKWAKVTRADYDSELQRLPPEVRGGFGINARRVSDLIARILLSKSLAARAREAGLDRDPAIQPRLALEMDKLVAGLLIARIEEDAGKAFDARREQFEGRAREIYLVDREKFQTAEQVSAAHILFDLKKHSREEGLGLAQQTRAKIAAGADFGQLAIEISDDPTAAKNAGSIGFFARTEMDPAFSEAAFALVKPGDVSDPVLSAFGWHLIKLEGRRAAERKSFDEVKALIMIDLRKKYIDEQRDLAVGAIRTDASNKSNEAAIDALVVRIAPELLKGAVPAPAATEAGPK